MRGSWMNGGGPTAGGRGQRTAPLPLSNGNPARHEPENPTPLRRQPDTTVRAELVEERRRLRRASPERSPGPRESAELGANDLRLPVNQPGRPTRRSRVAALGTRPPRADEAPLRRLACAGHANYGMDMQGKGNYHERVSVFPAGRRTNRLHGCQAARRTRGNRSTGRSFGFCRSTRLCRPARRGRRGMAAATGGFPHRRRPACERNPKPHRSS